MSDLFEAPEAATSATISACGAYRYDLVRRWGVGLPVVWVMLNPSTADALQDDATIRKCIGFTRRLGRNALTVVNLFAFRARDPREMKAAANPVGPENDGYIVRHATATDLVIAAWGPHGRSDGRDEAVLGLLRAAVVPVRCLHVTTDGSPGHPLYLPYERPLLCLDTGWSTS